MPVAAANGIQISYTDSGGEGPAVVFSHGFLMDHTMFGRQVTALTPQYRVVTWDQRGHGGTRATGAFTYWDSAADEAGQLRRQIPGYARPRSHSNLAPGSAAKDRRRRCR